jgi:hypothetical protein
MPDEGLVVGSSLESFARAADDAFAQIPGDPFQDGAAAARVTELWVTKGFLGQPRYHVALGRIEGSG